MYPDSQPIRIPPLLLLLPLLLLTVSGCKGNNIASQWAAEEIAIDGDMSEWPDSTRIYLKKEKALVGISNDGEYLYLFFRFGEPAWLMAMSMGTLTVWVDTAGKRSRELGFRYSGGIDPAAAVRAPGGRASPGDRDPSGGNAPARGSRPGQQPGAGQRMAPPALHPSRDGPPFRLSQRFNPGSWEETNGREARASGRPRSGAEGTGRADLPLVIF